MNLRLKAVLESISSENAGHIQAESRYYREVNIGRQAERMGFEDLKEAYRDSHAILLLKTPEAGMKVRVDGRTFVDYAQIDSQIVVPGRVAREAGVTARTYKARDSMVLVF